MLDHDSRPKLLRDTIYFQTHDGVFLKGGDSTFFLRGPSIYGWLASLSPRLDGETTLDEICQGLDEERRQMVVKLLGTLLDRGLVRQQPKDEPDLLDPEERRHFRTQIELVDHYFGRGHAGFARFRDSRVVVVGGGASFAFLGRALLRNGLRRLSVAPAAGGSDLAVVRGEVEALGAAGLEAELRVLAEAAAVELGGDPPDVVVYCSEVPDLAAVRELSRRCRQSGVRFLPALSVSTKAFVGPLVEPERPGCWTCSMLRLADASPAPIAADLWRSLCLGSARSVPPLGAPGARILGNTAGFALFKLLAGEETSELRGHVFVQSLETLESYLAPLQPHPACPDCGGARDGAEMPAPVQAGTGDPADEDEAAAARRLLDRAGDLIDLNFGLFQGFDDQDLPQLPLKTTALLQGLAGDRSDVPRRFIGFSMENVVDARVAALHQGLAAYFSATPAAGVLRASAADLRRDGLDPLLPEQVATWRGGLSLQEDEVVEWVGASSLLTGARRLVPAAAVHAGLDRRDRFERPPGQVAVANGHGEVAASALLAALAAEAIELASAEPRLQPLDPAALAELDSDLAFLVQSCLRFEVDFSIAALGDGRSPVAVVAAAAHLGDGGESIVRYGMATSEMGGARAALLELTGAVQLRSAGLPVAALPDERWDELSAALAASRDAVPRAPDHRDRTTEEVLDGLRAAGRDAFLVDVTTSDVRTAVPLIGGVVLLAVNPVQRQ